MCCQQFHAWFPKIFGYLLLVRSYGDLIREARERKGMSQDELAERLGVSASTISNMENSHHRPTIPKNFNALVLALGLSPEELLRAMGVEMTPAPTTRLPRGLVRAAIQLPPARLAQLEEIALGLLLLEDSQRGRT